MKNLITILLLIITTPVFAQYKITEYTRDTNMSNDDIACGANSPDSSATNACYTLGALKTFINAGISSVTNWADLEGLKSAVNWSDEPAYFSSNAINWQGLQQIQRADINWTSSNISVESATGNIGIGTIFNASATGERLTVSSPTIKVAKFISTQTSASGTGTALVDIVTDDGAAVSAGDIIARLRFLGSTNTAHSLGVGADIAVLTNEDWTGSANGTSMQFNTASNGSAGAATRMTINQANIGINTTNPSARLEVSTTTAQDIFKVNDDGAGDTTPFVISSTGNVGIGSATPNGALVIRTSTNDIGWTPVNAANQACNTTCTAGCVFGIDTGAVGNILACTDATADSCLCAGSN